MALCGPSKRDACPPMASFMAFERIKFSNVTAGANNDLFDAKDQMIHSAVVHENVLLSNNNRNSSVINPLSLCYEITLSLHSPGGKTYGQKDDITIYHHSLL